ncbi:MAG: STAS domain-containing protein [Bacteroidota bacterium]
MAVTVRNEDGVTILTPEGKLLGGKETEDLDAKIRELDQAGERMLILDLGRTTFMTSLAIAVVVRAHVSYSKRGGLVKLCAMDRHIRQIFEITRLTCVFAPNMHDTVEEGLASFRASALAHAATA